MIFVDSNIWAYYFDEEAPEHKYVIRPLERALREEEIAINTVIIMEVAHFLVKNLGAELGRKKLGVFLGFPFRVVELTQQLALTSVRLLAAYSHLGIGGRDATILAAMRELGINTIMTHDKAFRRVPGIRVIDPIPDASP